MNIYNKDKRKTFVCMSVCLQWRGLNIWMKIVQGSPDVPATPNFPFLVISRDINNKPQRSLIYLKYEKTKDTKSHIRTFFFLSTQFI